MSGVGTVVKTFRLSEAERDRFDEAARKARLRFSAWAREAMAEKAAGGGAGGVEGTVPQHRGSGDGSKPDAENGATGQVVGLTAPPPAAHHPLCRCRRCLPPGAA